MDKRSNSGEQNLQSLRLRSFSEGLKRIAGQRSTNTLKEGIDTFKSNY